MKLRTTTLLAGTSCMLALLAGEAAFAQQTAQATGGALEEILVTARRREEAIQTVPVAISAFNAAQLEERRVAQFDDLQHYVPSLRQFAAASRREGDSINVRSLPGTIIYVAEARTGSFGGVGATAGGPSAGLVAGAGNFYDLENIQVLKGPQGTLFGGLSSGGAILVTPKKPTNAVEGYADVKFGNYNNREFEAALNVPVVADKLMIRIAGSHQERDGYTTDIGPFFPGKKYDNRDHWAFRLGVTFKPIETVENYLLIDTYQRHTTGTGNKLLAVNFNAPFGQIFGALAQTVLNESIAAGPRATALSTDQLDRVDNRGLVDVLTWDALDSVTVKNIFSYREGKYIDRYEFEATRLPGLDRSNYSGWRSTAKVYTEEVNVNGKFLDDNLKLTAGFYYEKAMPLEVASSRGITFGAPAAVVEQGHGEKAWSRAFFGQGTFDLGGVSDALDGLSLTAGARRTTDFNQTVNFTYSPITGACSSAPGQFFPNCTTLLPAFKGSVTTFTFGVDYQLDDDTLLYAARRKGYRAGRKNVNVPLPSLVNVKPETIWDVEIGAKKDWRFQDMQARTNLALYRADYTDIQQTAGFFDAATGVSGTTTQNAAKAVVEGAELEATLVPVPQLELTASYALSIAYYKNYISQTRNGPLDLSGAAFPSNPRHKYDLTAKYHLPVPETMGDLSVSLNYFWQGSYWGSSPEVTPNAVQEAYGLLNLRMDWREVGGYPLDLGLYMTNVTNKTFLQAGNGGAFNSLGVDLGFYNEPRMYGVSLKYRFGPGL